LAAIEQAAKCHRDLEDDQVAESGPQSQCAILDVTDPVEVLPQLWQTAD
jgi:hypothetical protein